MVHNDVVSSKKSNCIDSATKILSVSSNRPTPQKPIVTEEENVDDFLMNEDYWDSFEVDQYVDDAGDHALAYMCSVLESKIMKSSKKIVKCEECITAFIENELIEDSFIRFKARSTNIMQPCKSTFEVCKFVDKFVKMYDGKKASYQYIVMQILRKIPFENLFSSSNFENHPDELLSHKYDFIKKIVESYMNMKSVYAAKIFTLNSHDAPLRHKYKKIIQERGE